ncbi:MAG: hypothetical protein Q9218_006334 [Villophora microphyllina]
MAVALGKRKRRKDIEANNLQDAFKAQDEDGQLQRLLRQYFESKFEPLASSKPVIARRPSHGEESQSPTIDTDWPGFSEDEEKSSTIVVDYQNVEKSKVDISREELKHFMTARPPVQVDGQPNTTRQKDIEPADPEEAATDAANLKKDLALQRLLKESHLLEPASSTAPSGQNRHKALDLRQQVLGSKSSVFSQQRMPLAQRKGIRAKAVERDEGRRREAKENGIILEKVAKSKANGPKRERGIEAPSVGKFSRGMLTLSKKDVASIVGPRKRSEKR